MISVPCRIPLLAAVAAFNLTGLAAEPAAPAKPNVVVILCDDLGRNDYSACGTADIRTPHIDGLCRDGMTFQNFYANSSVCSPSRAALLTGCYPDRVGVPGVIRDQEPDNSWGYLAPGAVLLPTVLRTAGYHSALIGKWHLGLRAPNTPLDRGFDVFRGFLGDMMDDYVTHLRHGENLMRDGREVAHPLGHATDVFTAWACAYLESRARERAPFFLYLAYNAPHDPIQPRADWLERVRARQPQASAKRTALVALIEHLDAGIGEVLGTLERTGQAANTLVIFTSDNGGVLANGANNGPWRADKGHMYEGGLRVPGAVRWPGRVAPGTTTARTTLTMDIFATVCEAAAVAPPPGIDGRSFLATLCGATVTEEERALYYVRREGGREFGGKTCEAFRHGRWKLVQDRPYAPLELFDLEADPKEGSDCAQQNPAVLKTLSRALQLQIQNGGRVPWQPPR